MPYIKITAAAFAAIKSRRKLPSHDDDPHPHKVLPDGYRVWFDEEVMQHLITMAFEGELISDTIIRAVTLSAFGGRLN